MKRARFCLRQALAAGTVVAVLILTARLNAATPIDPNAETPSATIGVLVDPTSKPGVLIDAVRIGSPADEVGLRPGDQIESLDGEPLDDWDTFRRVIREGQAGVARRLTVHRAGVTFDVLVVPGFPASGLERQERLFVPSYRTSCVRVRWYMPAFRLLAVGGLVLVALCRWSKVKGASTRPVLLGSTAWAIGTSAALGQSLLLCRLTGGWTLGMPLVASLTGNAVLLGLVTPFVLRGYQAASGHGERPWHETARIGAIYMIGANLAAFIMVMVMTSILPAIPSGHSLISGGLRLLDVGMNAVLLFLIATVLIGPIAEEVMFRGILLPWLDSWLPGQAGLAISSVLFGMAHIGYGYGALMPAASGWVLGWARQRTGGLKAPIALHMSVNGAVAVVALTRGSTRLFLIVGILLAVLIGAGSLVDDAAYRAHLDELQRSRRTG